MTKPLKLVTEVPTENSIKNRIITFLVQRGGLVMRINSGAVVGSYQGKRRWLWFMKWFVAGAKEQHGGASDIFCILPDRPGILITIETKRPGKKNNLTDKQRLFMAEAQKRGVITIIAESVADVQQALDLQ